RRASRRRVGGLADTRDRVHAPACRDRRNGVPFSTDARGPLAMLWRGGEITPLVPVRIMPAQGSVLRSKFPRTAPRPTLRSCLRSAMNANDKFFARDAHIDNAAVQPLPNSKKIFVEGSRPD